MFPAFEGLRAFGAFSVATAHSWPSVIRDLGWFDGSFLVVEMFFVLSGFLVTRACADRIHGSRDVAMFVVKRLGRLYPLHLAVLLAWIAIFYGKQVINAISTAAGIDLGMTPLASQASFDPGYFLLNLSMLHGIGIQDSLDFNFPAWSISAEFMAFLIVMVVFALARDRRTRVGVAVVALGACIVYVVLTWWRFGPPDAPNLPLLHKSLPRAAAAYFIGVLAFEWQRNRRARATDRQHGVMQALTVTCLMALVLNHEIFFFAQLLGSGLWAVLIVSLQSGQGWLARCLSLPQLVWIGQRSYAMYMTHALLLLIVQRRVALLEDAWLQNLAYGAYLAAAVALAAMAHRYIERPGYRPFQRLAGRLGRSTAETSSAELPALAPQRAP